jgi:hypothetical protein
LCGARAAADWLGLEKVPHLKVEVAPADLGILRAYRWQWGGNESERTNVMVTVREGTTVYTNVALHLKGAAGSFRPVDDRPAMTLHFGKGGSSQRFHGLEKLHLNNSVQDPSYACEVVAREMFNEAGLPTPRATHATVELNGRKLGLYVLVEGCDRRFLTRSFGNGRGVLYDAGFARDINRPLLVSLGTPSAGQSDLAALAEACADADTTNRLARIGGLLDVDRFLTLAALEILLTHGDGYCIGNNNYRVYHNPATDRLVFLPHGLDQLFGIFHSTPEQTITPLLKSIVARGVTQSMGGRARYMERVGTLYTNLFLGKRIETRVDALRERLLAAVGGDPDQASELEQAIAGLRQRIARRVASVGDQLLHPPKPVAFDRDGVLKVSGWRYKPDSSGRSLGLREQQDGHPVIGVRGGGVVSTTWGSWRRSLLLAGGEYHVVGRMRVERVAGDATSPAPQAAVRLSGDRSGYPRTTEPGWQEVDYRFSLADTTEVELICELRGRMGAAWFDEASLRLVRSSGSTAGR